MMDRSAGILLHPTSLPGRFGIGDLGYEAYNFINFLEAAGQKLWQVFPLGPTGYGDSPYQTFSAFAGNPLLVSPDLLVQDGLLQGKDLQDIPEFNPREIDFGRVIDYKYSLLRKAFKNFSKSRHDDLEKEFTQFSKAHKGWLDDYALFMAVKDYHKGRVWAEWPEDIAFRKRAAIKEWTAKLEQEVTFYKFIQFFFFRQWIELRDYAHERGIKIIGDLPIFIAYDSVDLWANKTQFSVDRKGKLLTVAGVPPDYFSETGQLWGNPLYKWDEMEKDDYEWWRKRFSNLFEMVDVIRIDHFRGFDAFWEIPGDAPTAITGRWVKGPGAKFFKTINKYLGELPIIAEDLGVITKSVEKLRDQFNFPGIKVLQFAFGTGQETRFLPHNIIKNSVVHTGSHDNDTTRGFFEKASKDKSSDIYDFTQKYINYYGSVDYITHALIKAAYASVADMVVIPMQDILNLGSEARMNYPGRLGGNWTWRFTWDQVPYEVAPFYKDLTVLYERPPKPKQDVEIEVS
ncbi:MAG: 4-alpha-glucanotransferase [Ignavibacteria bacterium]|jgi:4-alpha-glucanotransferase|nr:4-alpha-glucanotransferase [Ignavibacteria bacterium]